MNDLPDCAAAMTSSCEESASINMYFVEYIFLSPCESICAVVSLHNLRIKGFPRYLSTLVSMSCCNCNF